MQRDFERPKNSTLNVIYQPNNVLKYFILTQRRGNITYIYKFKHILSLEKLLLFYKESKNIFI